MRTYNETTVEITCNFCGTKKEVNKKTSHPTDVWVSELINSHWLITMVSPVPFGGIDICPECLNKIEQRTNDIFIDFYKILSKNDKHLASSAMKMAFNQLISRFIANYEYVLVNTYEP